MSVTRARPRGRHVATLRSPRVARSSECLCCNNPFAVSQSGLVRASAGLAGGGQPFSAADMVAKLVSIYQVFINQHINKKIHCAFTIALRKPRQRTTAASKPRPDAGRRKLNLRTPDHRRISRDRRSHRTFTSQCLLQQRLLHLYGVIASRGSCRTQRRSSCSPQRSSCCSSQCSSRCSSTLSQIMDHRRHLGRDPTLLFFQRLSRKLPIPRSSGSAAHPLAARPLKL